MHSATLAYRGKKLSTMRLGNGGGGRKQAFFDGNLGLKGKTFLRQEVQTCPSVSQLVSLSFISPQDR